MRGTILDEAKQVINGERQDQYGNPEDAFQLIASYWSIYLQLVEPIAPKDVAHMMSLLKMARIQHKGYHRDDYIDYCGYAALAHDLAETENE